MKLLGFPVKFVDTLLPDPGEIRFGVYVDVTELCPGCARVVRHFLEVGDASTKLEEQRRLRWGARCARCQ